MYKNKIQMHPMTFVLITAIILSSLAIAPKTFAISNEDIYEQKLVVQAELLDTLEEHVKLLQMLVIQKLELGWNNFNELLRNDHSST